MNKCIRVLFIAFVFYFFVIIGVNALDNNVKLYASGEISSTTTETFSYNNMSFAYDQNSDSSLFNFESITNNTDKSQFVSINILLFDKDKKNIGFVTYCSEKDLDGDYSQFKIKAKEAAPFSIKVSSKYFVSEKSSKDIAYYSVLDENTYCHIGGYDKYKGLSLEEINNGKVSDVKKTPQQELINISEKINYTLLFTYIMIVIVTYVVTGIILNELNKRMNATSTPIAYLPIGSNYIAVKLAFGSIVGKIYIVFLFISIILFVVGFRIIYYFLTIVSSIAFIIDIVKLISKKYDMLVFEPAIKSYVSSDSNNNINNQDVSYVNTLTEDQINVGKDDVNIPSNHDEVDVSSGTGNEIIDLNYSVPEEEGTIPLKSSVNTAIGTVDDKKTGEESDLSNLFK